MDHTGAWEVADRVIVIPRGCKRLKKVWEVQHDGELRFCHLGALECICGGRINIFWTFLTSLDVVHDCSCLPVPHDGVPGVAAWSANASECHGSILSVVHESNLGLVHMMSFSII